MKRFDDRFLDEIKSRLRPSDVIGRTVKLRRQGREYVGLSPFNKEKSPSFYVNDEKGFYHDFSSGKHGDLISFLQETERLSFREAIEKLAAEAGVPLPSPDPREAEAEQRRLGLGEWLEEAAKWFESQLRRPQGDGARAYLDKRGLPEAERGRFRLGYAPHGRTGLKDHLIAKGAQPKALVEAGLLIEPEDGGAPYDRFRDRIMFPITDARGRVISFGGRALDPEARAKYLNGPETPLFHKGSNLYGLPEARKLLHTGGEAAPLVVVEGYMDAIACQRAGVSAVAPLGTALTEEQMAALWRLHGEPTLCFDGDAAGQRAAHKAIDRALPLLKPGRSFRFALPAGGKDPDEVLREKGAAALKAQLAETRPLVDVLFERERIAAEPLDTPERRTALKVSLRKLAATIADPDLSQAYRQALDGRFVALPLPYGLQTVGVRRPASRSVPAGASAAAKACAHALARSLLPAAAAVVQAAIQEPALMDDDLEMVGEFGFGEPRLDSVARALVAARLQGVDGDGMLAHLAGAGLAAELKAVEAYAGLRLTRPWSEVLADLWRGRALGAELEATKDRIEDPVAYRAFCRLKAERNALQITLNGAVLRS